MPLIVRKFNAQVKDPQSGQMVPAGLLSSDSLQAIEAAESAAVTEIQQKGRQTRESIPDDYTELSDSVGELKTQLRELTISAKISSNAISRWEQGILENASGTYQADSRNIYTPDYYLIDAGTIIAFNGVSTDRNNFAYFYDKNKAFIYPRTQASPYPIPNNAVYVRFVYGFKTTAGYTVESYGGVNAVAADWSINCISKVESDIGSLDSRIDSLENESVILKELTTILTGEKDSRGGINYPLIVKAGVTYNIENTGESSITLTTRNGTTTAETIYEHLPAGESYDFTASMDTDMLRVYFDGASSFVIKGGRVDNLEADVKALNDYTSNFVMNIEETGNVCPIISSQRTSNGITLDPLTDGYYLHGTAEAYTVFSLFNSRNSFPSGMGPGKKYRLEYSTQKFSLSILLNYYDANGDQTKIGEFISSSDFTIPQDAVGFRARIVVYNGVTLNDIIRPAIFSYNTLSGARHIKQKETMPMLTIIYDDGKKLFKDNVLPVIISKNVPIATAIMPDLIGSVNYLMSWEEIQYCYANGAEVLQHSGTHTEEEWEAMGTQAISRMYLMGRNAIFAHGIHTPNTFVFAGSSSQVSPNISAAKRIFASAFGARGREVTDETDPAQMIIHQYGNINPYFINRLGSDSFTLDIAKAAIDKLVAQGNGWEVWTHHNIAENDVAQTQILADAIDYALSKGVQIVTAERGLAEYLDIT